IVGVILAAVAATACHDHLTNPIGRAPSPRPTTSLNAVATIDSTTAAGELLLDTTFVLPSTGSMVIARSDSNFGPLPIPIPPLNLDSATLARLTISRESPLLVEISGHIETN